MSFHPYLFFNGNCREAFEGYQKIFGGELQIVTADDVPGDDPVDPAMVGIVLHASLTYDDNLLMGSDDPQTDWHGVHGMQCNYAAADKADAERVFSALAEGGEITQELIETFFSPAFGMCVDRFGTPWMVVANEVPA